MINRTKKNHAAYRDGYDSGLANDAVNPYSLDRVPDLFQSWEDGFHEGALVHEKGIASR